MRESPYSDPKWIANLKHGILVDKNKNDINAREQEAHLSVLRDERDSQDRVATQCVCVVRMLDRGEAEVALRKRKKMH